MNVQRAFTPLASILLLPLLFNPSCGSGISDAFSPPIILISTNDTGRIFRSKDWGESWTKISLGGIAGTRFGASENGESVFVSVDNTVFHSTDKGVTWTVALNDAGVKTNVAVLPDNENVVVIGNLGNRWFSQNGGDDWSSASTELTGDVFALSLVKRSGVTSFIAAIVTADVTESSTNGDLWPDLSATCDTSGAYIAIHFDLGSEAGILVGVDTGTNALVCRSSDGGATAWATATAPPAGTGVTLYDVKMRSSTSAWVVGQSGYVAKTSDFGDSWSQVSVESSFDLSSVNFFENYGAISGKSGTLRLSDDGGDTWQSIDLDVNDHLFDVILLPSH